MPGPIAPVPCPECGGQMWDNSRDPRKSKKASDYRCKDRQNCNGGIWLSDADRANLAPAQAPVAQAPAGPRRPPLVLDKVMTACLEAAAVMAEVIRMPNEPPPADDIVLRIAQSLFIARTDNKGILQVEKAGLEERAKRAAEAAELLRAENARIAQEKADAERRAREDEAARGPKGPPPNFDDFPAALMDQDDDLPF